MQVRFWYEIFQNLDLITVICRGCTQTDADFMDSAFIRMYPQLMVVLHPLDAFGTKEIIND